MTTTTNVAQVKLNIMTQAQYTAATKNPNELYAVTDAGLVPSQTGNSGKFLSTNGTDTLWANVVDDASTTSATLGWSASKLNSVLGDIESTLNAIRGV